MHSHCHYGYHPSPLAATKLYCLVTEAHGYEQLAPSCYLIATQPGVKHIQLLDQKFDALTVITVMTPSYTCQVTQVKSSCL